MSILDYSYQLLSKLKNKEMTFSYVINKKIGPDEIDSPLVMPLKDAMKAVVNRYYFLAWEVKHYLKGIALSEYELDILVLALALTRYSRNLEEGRIESELTETLSRNGSALETETVLKMIGELKEKATTLPDVFNENFSKKISLNYAYPEWLVSMMRKHYGTRFTYKSIAASRKSTPISICTNEILTDKIEDEVFQKTETTANSYFYVGKKKLFEEELFLSRKVFVLDQSEQKVLDNLKIVQGEKILMYGKFEPSFVVDICAKLMDLGKVRVALENGEAVGNLRKVVQKFRFRSCEVFESPLNLICTHSSDDNDRVIVLPENSELGLIRKKPEVLLSLKKEDLDAYIEGETAVLNEMAQYVKSDGELDYLVPTLNKKESFGLIRNFLQEHPQFGLIEEKTIFPFEYKGEGIYYARLRKLGK